MSKLLTVLLSFVFVVTSLAAHAVVPVSAANEVDCSQFHAIHSCQADSLFSVFEGGEKTNDKNLSPGETHHCLFDFVILMAPTSNLQMPVVLRDVTFVQRQLSPILPEYQGKPPKA
jgi:hypothetical protein